jgi:hypothetical protein
MRNAIPASHKTSCVLVTAQAFEDVKFTTVRAPQSLGGTLLISRCARHDNSTTEEILHNIHTTQSNKN